MAKKPNIGAKITLDGEKEYRQAIGNVNKSMSVLRSELKAVSAEYEGNANSLDALRAKNDLFTKQQLEQEKKLQLLRGALENASKQYGENSKHAQDWQIKLNNAYTELQKINRELNQNEKYMKEAEQSTDKTANSIDEFGNRVKETKEETLKFGDVLKANLAGEAIVQGVKALGSALRDVAKATIDVVKDTAEYADNIMTLSAQTGIAIDTLQELNYMAELTDTSLDTITSTMARNIRSMNSASNGTKLYVDAYRQLGIQVTDTNGQLRDSETVYWEAVEALGRMANETERDAIAMQLFGRSAQDLNPLIKIGKDGMAEFAREAREMGAVLSEDTLEGLGQTDDALQRLYQQFDIAKRKIGIEAAPGITEAIEKITAKVGEADDEFAEFISGGLGGVTDAFIWIIDNADLIISGLKGVGAALITKKAADGVTYAIEAYGKLKTATEAATTAQVAFNTASKASVIGAIASVVIGLGTALVSYAKSSSDAAEETRKLNDETEKLLRTSREYHEEISKNIKNREKSTQNIVDEYEAAKKLSYSLYELADKERKTSSEKAQMIALVEQLNNIMPELNLTIDEQTGYLNKQSGEVNRLIEAEIQLQRVKLAGANIAQIELDRIKEEQILNDLLTQREEKEKALARANQALKDTIVIDARSKTVFDTYDDDKTLEKEIKDLTNQIEESTNKMNILNSEYDTNMKYIGDHSVIDAATSAIKEYTTEFEKALQNQSEAEITTLEDRMRAVDKIYNEASKELKKRLRAEEREFDKSQEARVKSVEKSQKKELRSLEKAHKKKLKMLDDEYLKKLKVVDEQRYKELKSVQDQLDVINAQQEAEDRALKAKEEAEKRAELQARINTAKTIEDKIQAQEDLADFEEDIARDRRKTERELQKDILELQKDTINDTYDKKLETLEKEKKKAEEIANEEYKVAKDAIDARYKLKIEALKEELALEKESFKDRQTEYEAYLKKQRELASANAKKIYEDDLTQYKLNQALKYDPSAVDSEAAKKHIKEYAYNSMDPGMARDAILKSNDLQEMLKYYNPKALTNTPEMKSSQNIDYSLFSKAVKDALKDTRVVLDNKIVGQIVTDTVNNMIR